MYCRPFCSMYPRMYLIYIGLPEDLSIILGMLDHTWEKEWHLRFRNLLSMRSDLETWKIPIRRNEVAKKTIMKY